jgi:hypothetical protein
LVKRYNQKGDVMEIEKEQEVEQVVEQSTEANESSNEVQEVAQPEEKSVETPVEKKSVPEVRQPQVEEFDEMGVPYKNRYMEMQRKFKNLEDKFEKIQTQTTKQPETQKYTAEQLRAFAISTDDANNRAWALNELEKVSEEKFNSVVENKLSTIQKQQREDNIRLQTFNGVVTRNPDMVVKDSNGNIVGFNTTNPLYNRMDFYMRNSEIASRPEALEIAEAFAYRDIAHAQKPVINNTIQKQANQIKSLQKKTMVEGSGKNSNVKVSSRQAAVDRAKQTGDIKDAANAMGAILRDAGIISD